MVIFMNIINLHDNILINNYWMFIKCNRPTLLHHPPPNDSKSKTIRLMWSPLDHIRERDQLLARSTHFRDYHAY